MSALSYWLICMVLLSVLACSEQKPTASEVTNSDSSLTIEQWKSLPPSEKYDGAALKRLRKHDDKLKSERAWQKFMKKVVGPEMRVDMPRPDAKS